MGVAGAVIGVASSVIGGVAAIQQGRSQARQTREIGEFNAMTAIQEAEIEERRLRRSQARTLAFLRTGIAGRGVQLSGTALDLLADQVAQAEENALLVRFQGQRRAEAILFGAEGEADFAKQQGLISGISGLGGGIGTFLGGLEAEG